jgi:hypothetical protein
MHIVVGHGATSATLALNYWASHGGNGFIGASVIFFIGCLRDVDHYIGNWKRVIEVLKGLIEFLGACVIFFIGCLHYIGNRKQIVKILKELRSHKITIGTPAKNRLNYFHTWWFTAGVVVFSTIVALVGDYKLATLSLLAELIHFAIDVLNSDVQNYPNNNPAMATVHIFLWKRLPFFRKLCFDKHLLPQSPPS